MKEIRKSCGYRNGSPGKERKQNEVSAPRAWCWGDPKEVGRLGECKQSVGSNRREQGRACGPGRPQRELWVLFRVSWKDLGGFEQRNNMV